MLAQQVHQYVGHVFGQRGRGAADVQTPQPILRKQLQDGLRIAAQSMIDILLQGRVSGPREGHLQRQKTLRVPPLQLRLVQEVLLVAATKVELHQATRGALLPALLPLLQESIEGRQTCTSANAGDGRAGILRQAHVRGLLDLANHLCGRGQHGRAQAAPHLWKGRCAGLVFRDSAAQLRIRAPRQRGGSDGVQTRLDLGSNLHKSGEANADRPKLV
mmetsp:Transcript_1873/g.4409  ORF Transcript_1873/g.4409 Transcript_1873/m.4409 type:complete len:217 (+) Transcript_1873:242-892(+)